MVLITWRSFLALMVASSALATPLIAEPIVGRDLEIRQTQDTSNCDPKGYTSQNGMNFTTYCGQNNPFNDAFIPPLQSGSMTDCMEHCSRYWNGGLGEGCFGIVWVPASTECWIRNSTTSTKGLVPAAGSHSALIVKGNLDGFDTSCPAADKSVSSLSGVDGLQYTMNCNKVVGGFDACFSGYGSNCWSNPYRGFYHAKSLEECLRICIDQHPLCKAVSWSADLRIGFANCWPKTGFPDSLSTPGPKEGVIHSATITTIDSVNNTCPSSKTYTATGKKNFDIHCGQAMSGQNITSLHTQNITACMDNCASSDKGCIGIVFDPSLAGGFKNCYLQNTTNTVSTSSLMMYAVLSKDQSNNGDSSSSNSNNNSSSSSGGSKAWIAGPVIGGLALLFALAFAIFFFRRRKAAKAASNPAEKDGHEFGAYGPAPAYSPSAHQPPELGAHEHAANELPASTKYAHSHKAKETPVELA